MTITDVATSATIAATCEIILRAHRRLADYGRIVGLAVACLQDASASAEARCQAALAVLQMEREFQ